MTDAETLRAAAEVLRGRMQRPETARTLDLWADGLAAEDAAKLKAAERDQELGLIAERAWYAGREEWPARGAAWRTVARAVREAIEAEQ